jgi:hypothetical protein
MTPLYLDWNLGLGDAIICNGLVRWYARTGCEIILPCWEHNLPTVRHMFSDLANVRVALPVNGDARPQRSRDYEVLSIGVNNPHFGAIEPWDRAFYEFAGVPFDAKWDLFYVPESGSEIRVHGRYMLVHEDNERGFGIDPERLDLPIGKRGMGFTWSINKGEGPLTDWRNVIRDAAEIHMIDSAPMHLAELLPTTGKLFYHKYARAKGNRNHQDATFRKDWKVIE